MCYEAFLYVTINLNQKFDWDKFNWIVFGKNQIFEKDQF